MAHPLIRVEVKSQFLPDQSELERKVYAFTYTITLHNVGSIAAQLISRHWVIEDALGRRHEVRGLGAGGHQPLIAPGEMYRYINNCSLGTDSGTVHGSYFFVTEDGERFDVPIPMFVLDVNGDELTQARVLH